MRHIEGQWTKGMTWRNHGRNGWHIDHRRPVASFDLSSSREQRMCFHFTNLLPMWSRDNRLKGDKFEERLFSHVWHNGRWVARSLCKATL